MPTIQDQYTEFTTKAQDATLAIAQAWTRSFQETVTRVPVVASQAAVNAAAQQFIDQAYDFASTVIDVQRTFSTQLVESSATVAEDVAKQATAALNDAGAQVVDAATKAGRAKKTAA